MAEDNLWGEIPNIGKVDTPLSLLKKQASYLGQMTKNLLQSEVSIQKNSPNEVVADLLIVAPTLGGYKASIIRIIHGLELYPVSIYNLRAGTVDLAGDEDSFLEIIRITLQSDVVKKVIKALLIQVEQPDII